MRFPLFNRRDTGTPPVRATAPVAHPAHPAGSARTGPSTLEGACLADEAEAFVNGELAAYRSSQALPLPAWLLLNRLAHGDLVTLRALAQGQLIGRLRFGRDHAWAAAEHDLARCVLADAALPSDVVALQQDVLVPLEGRLIEGTKIEPLSLGDVVAAATNAIAEHRQDR